MVEEEGAFPEEKGIAWKRKPMARRGGKDDAFDQSIFSAAAAAATSKFSRHLKGFLIMSSHVFFIPGLSRHLSIDDEEQMEGFLFLL